LSLTRTELDLFLQGSHPEVAGAKGRVVTLPAKRGPGRIGVYVFVRKPEK